MYEEHSQHPSTLVLVGQGLNDIGESLMHYRSGHQSPRVRRSIIGGAAGAIGAAIALVMLRSLGDQLTNNMTPMQLSLFVVVGAAIVALVGFLSTPHSNWEERLLDQLGKYMPLHVSAYNDLQFKLSSGETDTLFEVERWYARECSEINRAFAVTGVNEWGR